MDYFEKLFSWRRKNLGKNVSLILEEYPTFSEPEFVYFLLLSLEKLIFNFFFQKIIVMEGISNDY